MLALVRSARNFRASAALIVSLTSVVVASGTGCVPGELGSGLQTFPQLHNEPFAMPDALPKPPDAKILLSQRAAKGGNAAVAFETHWSLAQLFDFYRRTIPVSGLVEDDNYRSLDETRNHALNLAFKWWPGQKGLYINAVDQAYSSSHDVRMVSVQIQ